MAIQGTRLETDEDVPAGRRCAPSGAARPGASGTSGCDRYSHASRRRSSPVPPRLRPPTPILTIYDDGSEEGEVIRIRQDRFIIGRTEGDLIIPNDSQISSHHAESSNRWSKRNIVGT